MEEIRDSLFQWWLIAVVPDEEQLGRTYDILAAAMMDVFLGVLFAFTYSMT